MSKIADRIISITEKVKINLGKGVIFAEGPLGKSEELIIPSNLEVINQENKLSTKSANSALAGTYNSLISNLIKGVAEGHESIIEVKVESNKVIIRGKNKQKVTSFAAAIRGLRLPSIYKKDKGIYYLGEAETIKLKARKSSGK